MGAGFNTINSGTGQQVYYDASRGQYYTQGPTNAYSHIYGGGGNRNYIGGSPSGKGGAEGSEAGLAPNQNMTPRQYSIQNYMPAGLTAYGGSPVTAAPRPSPVVRPQPQFDMSFLQQLANRPPPSAPAMPARPTLTPGGMPSTGGLAALNAIGGQNAGV